MTDITFRRPISWDSSLLTDVGCVRTVNEDAVLARPDIGLWAVADGMGGHKVGDIASSKIVAALDVIKDCQHLSECVQVIEDCLLDVNQLMLEYAQIMFDGGTMGSTVVAAVIKGRIGACLWVGDSRLYRFRNQKLVQITRDHSQLEEMIAMGLITRAGSENHPNRNVITRAVGVEPQLYVDMTLFTTQVGDTFLLCSDGLYNAVTEEQLIQNLNLRDVQQCAQQLMKQALENGARDNVSVVVVKGNPGKVPTSENAQG
ncbi:MAG TPA: protein phosphatase 2C domain-containing protein [Cellvibrio sp.]